MASVLNRVTKQYLPSANTPDYSIIDWIINPDLSLVQNIPVKYWKITNDIVSEMSQAEKDIIDTTESQSLEDSEILQLNSGILRRFVLVLLDEINRARVADGMQSVTISQLKTAMRAK